MEELEMRRRLGEADVARLATVSADLRPHLVPICLALARDVIYTAIDAKPKRTARLRRLENVRANPAVSVLVDHYEDEWERLWWVRADGSGSVHDEGPEWERGVQHLRAKYTQYRVDPPDGPVIAIAIDHWSGWAANEDVAP